MAKQSKCEKRYVTPSDTEGKRSWFDGATALEFRFANDVTEAVNPNDFSDDMKIAFMFFGVSEKLGNAYAGAKDPDDAYEKFMALKEQIESGNWVSEREGAGPRISLVVKAIVAAKAKAGVETTEEEVAAKYQELSKEQRSTILEDKRINAEYQRIRAEQAAERAAKAAAAAGAEPTTGEGFAI